MKSKYKLCERKAEKINIYVVALEKKNSYLYRAFK
jgi:hypothetical protein